MLRIRHNTGTLPFECMGMRLIDGNKNTYEIIEHIMTPQNNYNQGTCNDADSLVVLKRDSDEKTQKISFIFLDNFLHDKHCQFLGGDDE